jgi:hypothetical protein
VKSPLPRTLAESLRDRSEHYLTVAAQEDLRRRYPRGTSAPASDSGGLFWRRVFVPVYRRVPWATMQRVIGTARMTSQGWTPPSREPSEPWRPPTGGAGPPA